jgi:HK97 gp10 family phage protein
MAKASAKVVITGIKELDRDLEKLGPALSKKVTRKGLRKAAKVLAKEVKAEAPKDTGELSKAVKVKSGKRSQLLVSTYVAIIDEELGPIANHLEWGTEHNAANPFMRRTADTQGDRVLEIAREELAEQVSEAIKEAGF